MLGNTLAVPSIYFDNNATTPVEPEVLEAMLPFLTQQFGNPSSAHSFGSTAAQAVARARAEVAALVGASSEQVFFCSSATEGINWALSARSGNIITSEVEHAATLKVTAEAAPLGGQLTRLRVDRAGQISLDALEERLKAGSSTVAMMWANNETGVVCPIEPVADLCERYGAQLHVDAVQAAGKLPIDFSQLPISSMVISSHKLFGPKGAAALIAREPAQVATLIWGGGQERNRRSGTENVPAIVGFGAACARAARFLHARAEGVQKLRDTLETAILERVPKTWVNGAGSTRLANTTNIGFESIDAETLAGLLDADGIAVSTGSACHANTLEPSHVIRAMTGSYQQASESVRFSLSHLNTREEVDAVVDAVCSAVAQLR